MTKHFRISFFFRLLAILAAVLAVLYFGAVLVIGTHWFHDMLVRRVTQRLESETGAVAEMRELEIKPMIFEVIFRGLTLRNPGPSTEPPLFSSKTLVVRINPLSVLRGRLLISWLDGEDVQIRIATRRDGSPDFPTSQAERGEAFRRIVNVSIRRLVLNGACFYWNDRKIPLDLSARKVALLLSHGRGGVYAGSVSASSLNWKARGIRLPELVVASRITLSHQAIDLIHLVWRSAAGSGNGEIHLQMAHRLQGIASLRGQGNLQPLARILGWKHVRSGSYNMMCNVAYLNGSLAATGHVQADNLLLRNPSFSPGPLNLGSDFSGNADHVKLTNVSAYALGGAFHGVADIIFRNGKPEVKIQGQVGRVALAKALNAVPAAARLERLFPMSSRVNGSVEATWNGGFEGLRAAFDLNAEPGAAAPGDVFPLTGYARGSLRYNREIDLTLAQSQFETPHSSLQAQGTLGQAGSHLSISYTTSAFQETARLLDALTGHSKSFPLTLRSAATFSGTLTGTLADPSVRGQIDLGQFNYKGWDWQSLQGGVSASPEGIAIKSGHLRSGKSVFNFDASASLTSWKVTTSSQLAFSATAIRSPLQGLEDAFAVRFPLRGVASGELKIAGPPANLAGEGSFQLVDGSFAGERFQRLSGLVLVTGSAFDFCNVTLQKGAGKLTGEAKVVWPSRSFSMKFRGGSFSLGDFETLQGRLPGSEAGREEKPLQGVLSLVAEGSGKLNDPQIRSNVTIQDLALEGKPAGKLEADFRLAGDRLTGVGRLRGAGGESDFNAVIGMHGDWPLELNGKLVNFRLDPWISLSGGNLATPVVASGSVSISGPLKERAKITAVADIRSLAVEIPGFSLTNSRPFAIRFKKGLIESSNFEMRGPSTRLQILLSGRLGPPVDISLNAVGSAQASLLGILDPSIKAVGNIMLNLHAEGNPARPSLSGEVQVRDLSLRSEDLPLPLSGLNGTVLLDGNRATLKSFGEKNGQTSIRMSGYVTLGPNPVFRLQADFAHVRLEYPAGFTSLLTGQVQLRGPAPNPELTGEAVVGQMFADENFNVVDWIGQMGQSFQTPPTRGPQDFPFRVRLDVRVMTSPTVRLNSRTLSYTGSIDLTLRGALARPAITGSIHLSQGQALVAGVRYQINRGDITMTNPTQIAPMVDIEAQTRVERYNLTIEISGSANHPRISYRSDPPLPTEQIVSLLALGYAPQQALISSTGSARMGAIGAGSLLTQALSNQVSGRFQRLFGASRIRIDPNLLGPSTAGGARVTVEEKVSKDVTITYSTNTAAAQQRDIRMRWDVSNKISLIGERDINGVYGFEVRFRRRVR